MDDPVKAALARLQQTNAQTTIDPSMGPIPAGDLHNGPQTGANPLSQQQAYALSLQSIAQPSQQTSTETAIKGSIDFNQLKKEGYSPTQIEGYLSDHPGVTLKNAPKDWDASIMQPTIIPKAAPLTETFGQIQPGVEVFSHGVTTGTGIGVKQGTPLATPPGKWKVVETYDKAPLKGYIGNSAGQGWGNNVLVQNQQTGEMLRYSHLSQVGVTKGDTISGERVIGLSGQSGNTTGDHLNLQYITPSGQPADVLQSQYAKYLPIEE